MRSLRPALAVLPSPSSTTLPSSAALPPRRDCATAGRRRRRLSGPAEMIDHVKLWSRRSGCGRWWHQLGRLLSCEPWTTMQSSRARLWITLIWRVLRDLVTCGREVQYPIGDRYSIRSPRRCRVRRSARSLSTHRCRPAFTRPRALRPHRHGHRPRARGGRYTRRESSGPPRSVQPSSEPAYTALRRWHRCALVSLERRAAPRQGDRRGRTDPCSLAVRTGPEEGSLATTSSTSSFRGARRGSGDARPDGLGLDGERLKAV